jgi:hypothetical protein
MQTRASQVSLVNTFALRAARLPSEVALSGRAGAHGEKHTHKK